MNERTRGMGVHASGARLSKILVRRRERERRKRMKCIEIELRYTER